MIDKFDLEFELDAILAELQQLYDLERSQIPYVDDRVRGEIYHLQDRRDEINRLLADADGRVSTS